MSKRVTVSDVTAPALVDAINNHVRFIASRATGVDGVFDRDGLMSDERRQLDELTAAADKLRAAL